MLSEAEPTVSLTGSKRITGTQQEQERHKQFAPDDASGSEECHQMATHYKAQ